MTSTKNPTALHIAEALLAFQAATVPELARPDNTDRDPDARRPIETVAVPAGVLTQLLEHERGVELELAQTGQSLPEPLGYGLALATDKDGHVTCLETAVIPDEEDGIRGIVLDRPTIDGLIEAGRQRPLSDQIRVFSYLVRLGCQLIGGRGGVTGIGGDAVRFLRDSVRILRELVRLARLEQGDQPGDATHDTADGSDRRPELTPNHTPDSIREKEKAAGSSGGHVK